MQKNIFLTVEYDGTNFLGWQIQNNRRRTTDDRRQTNNKKKAASCKLQVKRTVQGELEKALTKLFKQDIRVIYSSRTDTSVHANAQAVNFTVDTKVPLNNIKRALNGLLTCDIKIKEVKPVKDGFHARFDVKSKEYRYFISEEKDPSVFSRNYLWQVSESLDVERMRKAGLRLTGKKDFSLFAKDAGKYKSCVRTVYSLKIRKVKGIITVAIEADGFLRYMVRNIVSFLVLVGKKKIKLNQVNSILSGKIKYKNHPAPGCGLYLYKVKY